MEAEDRALLTTSLETFPRGVFVLPEVLMVRARMESTKVDGAGPDGDSGAGPGGVTRNLVWW